MSSLLVSQVICKLSSYFHGMAVIETVARNVGNSADVILKHYRANRDIEGQKLAAMAATDSTKPKLRVVK